MSSSRIIRGGGELQRPYLLEPLAELPPLPEQEFFRAVPLGGEPEPEREEQEAEDAPSVPCIPEEEALSRIREARAEGAEEGREEARRELAAALSALSGALRELAPLRGELMQEAEEELLKLSVAIARKVILREILTDPRVLAGLVRGALEAAGTPDEVVVRLNPDQYLLVGESPELQDPGTGERSVIFKPDPAVPPAGCLVETLHGALDAGVDAQLDEIMRKLQEEKSARGTRRARK